MSRKTRFPSSAGFDDVPLLAGLFATQELTTISSQPLVPHGTNRRPDTDPRPTGKGRAEFQAEIVAIEPELIRARIHRTRRRKSLPRRATSRTGKAAGLSRTVQAETARSGVLTEAFATATGCNVPARLSLEDGKRCEQAFHGRAAQSRHLNTAILFLALLFARTTGRQPLHLSTEDHLAGTRLLAHADDLSTRDNVTGPAACNQCHATPRPHLHRSRHPWAAPRWAAVSQVFGNPARPAPLMQYPNRANMDTRSKRPPAKRLRTPPASEKTPYVFPTLLSWAFGTGRVGQSLTSSKNMAMTSLKPALHGLTSLKKHRIHSPFAPCLHSFQILQKRWNAPSPTPK